MHWQEKEAANEEDAMSDQNSTGASTTERGRSGSPLANPRRVRLGRDGRPLPAPSSDED
jgi:hypothetical protein